MFKEHNLTALNDSDILVWTVGGLYEMTRTKNKVRLVLYYLLIYLFLFIFCSKRAHNRVIEMSTYDKYAPFHKQTQVARIIMKDKWHQHNVCSQRQEQETCLVSVMLCVFVSVWSEISHSQNSIFPDLHAHSETGGLTLPFCSVFFFFFLIPSFICVCEHIHKYIMYLKIQSYMWTRPK